MGHAIIDGNICGVCGKPAVTFFVHGYRCKEHGSQREPSDAIFSDNVIMVVPGLHGKTKGPFKAHEIIMVTK